MEGVGGIGSTSGIDAWRQRRAAGSDEDSGEGTDFAEMITNGVQMVSNSESSADQLAERFAVGDPSVQLHDVTVAAAESALSVQMMVAVRDRALEAYQQVINLQV